MIDYQKEFERIENTYWSPKAGHYKILFLSEMENHEPFIDEETQKSTPRVKVKISIENIPLKSFIWVFGVGNSQASIYGQLCSFATKNNNSLNGKSVSLVVNNDGNKNTYTIVY